MTIALRLFRSRRQLLRGKGQPAANQLPAWLHLHESQSHGTHDVPRWLLLPCGWHDVGPPVPSRFILRLVAELAAVDLPGWLFLPHPCTAGAIPLPDRRVLSWFWSSAANSLYVVVTLCWCNAFVAGSPGYYCPSPQLTAPTPCPVGFVCALANMSAPVPCPKAHFCSDTGMLSAMLCKRCRVSLCAQNVAGPRGFFCPSAQSVSPAPCPLGSYCPADGLSEAALCPEGHFCPELGLANARPCMNSLDCTCLIFVLCETAGMAGSYCAGFGNSKQTPCLPGFMCPDANMTSPLPCLIGRFCPYAMTVASLECPPFTASPGGAQRCTPCPYGVSSDRSRCLFVNESCAAGFGKEPNGCTLCPRGRFSDGTTPCTRCAESTYSNVNGTARCLRCTDAGVACDTDTGLGAPRRGYWSFVLSGDRTGELHTVPCVVPSLCLGPSPSNIAVTLCEASRLQSADNVECAMCDIGRSEWSGECLRCDSANGGMVLLVMLLCWLYVIVSHRLAQDSASLSAVFMYFVQIALVIVGSTPGITLSSWLNVFGMSISDVGGGDGVLPCVGPISPVGKLVLSLFTPFFFVVLLGLTLGGHKLLASVMSTNVVQFGISFSLQQPNLSAYSRTLLALTLYSFTTFSTVSISALNCMNVAAERVVVSSPAVRCTGADYHALFSFAVLLLVLCALLPIFMFWFLFRRRAEVQSARSAERLGSWGILVQPFKPKRFFWSIVVLLRRTAYAACVTIQQPQIRFMAFALVGVCCGLLHHSATPYIDRHANGLESLSLACHVAIAVVLSAFPAPTLASAVIVALMVLLPTAIFLVMLLLSLRKTRLSPFSDAVVMKELT